VVFRPIFPDWSTPGGAEEFHHGKQLRLNHVFQEAVHAAYSGARMDANAFSLRPAKPVVIGCIGSGDEIRSMGIVVSQVAVFVVARDQVSHLASPPSARSAGQ
jgi:hypothetical protein